MRIFCIYLIGCGITKISTENIKELITCSNSNSLFVLRVEMEFHLVKDGVQNGV